MDFQRGALNEKNASHMRFIIIKEDTSMKNIPDVKLGIIAVSRDCFPIGLSVKRREAIVKAYKGELYECTVTVENEKDMLAAVADVKTAGCNARTTAARRSTASFPPTLCSTRWKRPGSSLSEPRNSVPGNLTALLHANT